MIKMETLRKSQVFSLSTKKQHLQRSKGEGEGVMGGGGGGDEVIMKGLF